MENKKPRLILTMGLPRASKSTWARSTGFPVVNPDSIRLVLTGQAYLKEAEPMVWAVAKTMVRSLFLAGHDTVVLDATNVTHTRRDEWLSEDWEAFIVIFRTPAEICKGRAVATGQEYLLPVIERMEKDWQEPSEQWTVIEELYDVGKA